MQQRPLTVLSYLFDSSSSVRANSYGPDNKSEDYFYSDGVCIIEWANLIEEIIPSDAISVTIEKNLEKGFDYRKIQIKAN